MQLRPEGADKADQDHPRPMVDRLCAEELGLEKKRRLSLGSERESLGTGECEGWCDRCGRAVEEGRGRRRRARGG